jgi:hypothetical protein
MISGVLNRPRKAPNRVWGVVELSAVPDKPDRRHNATRTLNQLVG